jgi:hypothetical protein
LDFDFRSLTSFFLSSLHRIPLSLQVIHKNYYYRDSEKYRMVERIATLHDQLERHLRAREQDEDGVDLVLQSGFRKVRSTLSHKLAQPLGSYNY